MQAIWKGAITFGLVNIPVALYSAVRKEELKFRLLRKSDLSPVNYRRVAEADGKEVPWEEIVKGYEYERGKFVVLKDEDFKRADLEAAQTIHIVDFVSLKEIDPIYFDKPYYLEPQKGGTYAYALLRDVMLETGTIGIAKVVLRSKQHLAALKPRGHVLVLELMYFADEVVEPGQFKAPEQSQVPKQEFELARALVGKMTNQWNPAKYTDEYRSALLELIEKKVKEGEKGLKKRPAKEPVPANVLNMVEMLEKSLSEAEGTKRSRAKEKKQRAAA